MKANITRGFKLSKSKIENAECKFSKRSRTQDYSAVTLEERELQINNQFRYLCSTSLNDRTQTG